MKARNEIKVQFASKSVNEGLARGILAAFMAQADPTVTQLADMKTAVSEAVTNCIVHAYPEKPGVITMKAAIYEDRTIKVTVADKGIGIENVEQAMEPLFTTGNEEERAGLGFAVMQTFTDRMRVKSEPGKGTRVTLYKKLTQRG